MWKGQEALHQDGKYLGSGGQKYRQDRAFLSGPATKLETRPLRNSPHPLSNQKRD